MKKMTLIICYFSFCSIVLFNPVEIKANYIPGIFNNWTQNTLYSTNNMPSGFKKYTTQASNDNEFKLLMWNDNWNAGWGSGYWISSWNIVWSLPYVSSGLNNALVKNFGTNQYMTVVTSTALGGATSNFGFLKTSASPINIASVSGGTANVNTSTSVSINIVLSGNKCAEEYVLLRYTIDNWATSSIVNATGSGTSYSVTIPGQIANTTAKWYALTSTLSNPSTDIDYLTLSVMNNSGTNYSYFTGQSTSTDNFRSKTSGNWNSAATWESSNDNSTWIPSTLVPTSSATSVAVLSGHKVNVDLNLTIATLTINSTGILEVNAAKQLTISTSLTNNGTLTLKSTSTDGTATILTPATITGSGSTVVEQYLASTTTGVNGRNWYISSPLSAATSSTITNATGNGLVYYDGTSTWPAAGTTMGVMTGYIAVSPAQNTTIQFIGGSLNTGDKSVSNLPLGFNLVGNPYASSVDWSQATKTAISTSIWYRSKSTGSYLFQTYNVAGIGVGVNGGTNIIPPMQSFWVKTTSATNTLGFTNSMRSHLDQSVATNRLKAPAVNTQKLLRLEVASGLITDETVIYFNENALNTFDEYDSQKMFSETALEPELYTFTDGKNLVINGFNTVPLNTEISLGFRTDINDLSKKYYIKSTQLQNFESNANIVLVDKANNNKETTLSEGAEYEFNSEAANTTSRFSIIFKSAGNVTDLIENNSQNVSIYKDANNQICIDLQESAKSPVSVSVFNSIGQKISTRQSVLQKTVIGHVLASGVYVVAVQGNGINVTRKICIN